MLFRSEESFTWARRRYYELLDWDGESGVPAGSCLANLQLPELGLQL